MEEQGNMYEPTRDLQIRLYSSKVSDCSARLRIALNLKKIAYELINISMTRGDTESAAYIAINPARTVPCLVLESQSSSTVKLNQSIAALEYLEEAFPHSPNLLPPLNEPVLRAEVRTLMAIVATDIHPLTTPRVGRALVSRFPSSQVEVASSSTFRAWDTYWIARGLQEYEKAVESTCGKYSIGDQVTLADVVLVPEIWTGLRYGVDLSATPKIANIYANLCEINDINKERSEPETT